MKISFNIAGVQYGDMATCIDDMKVRDELDLVPEQENEHNINAVRIEFKGVKLGYVPNTVCYEVSTAIGMGRDLKCEVAKLDPKEKSWKQCKVVITEEG